MQLSPEQYRSLRQSLPERREPFLWRPAVVVGLVEVPAIMLSVAVALLRLPVLVSLALLLLVGLFSSVAVMTLGHDGQHRRLFRSDTVSAIVVQLAGFGISRPWWVIKHNQMHHTGTPGSKYEEPPLDLGRFTRLAPDQPWRPWHRWQVVYFWPILAVQHTAMIWQSTVFSITGRFRGRQYGERTVRAAIGRLAAQLGYLGALTAIGVWRHGALATVAGLLIVCSVIGVATGLVLVVEIRCRALAATAAVDVDHANDDVVVGRGGWATYQLRASMSVNRSSTALAWLTGSLNLHTAHHLFPSLPSYQMPDVDAALRELVGREGLVLNDYMNYRQSWRSFAAFLVDLGRRPDKSGEPG